MALLVFFGKLFALLERILVFNKMMCVYFKSVRLEIVSACQTAILLGPQRRAFPSLGPHGPSPAAAARSAARGGVRQAQGFEICTGVCYCADYVMRMVFKLQQHVFRMFLQPLLQVTLPPAMAGGTFICSALCLQAELCSRTHTHTLSRSFGAHYQIAGVIASCGVLLL